MYLSGNPSMVRDDGDGFLNFDWGERSPSTSCGIGSDRFSVYWTRTLYFDSGTWRFTVTADDGVRLYIDGSLQLDEWIDQPPTTYTVEVDLTAGNHTIELEYYENGGEAVVKLNWTTPWISDGFDYPVGETGYVTEDHDGDGWYNAQDFGFPNPDFGNKLHLGEDWNGEGDRDIDCCESVYAVSRGTIVYAEDAGSRWGNVIIIRHDLPDGTQVESLYGHLQSMTKTTGTVERRKQIGTIGKDGWPSCHLHFEIRFSNCPSWGTPGPGYNYDTTGWTDPSDFINAHRPNVDNHPVADFTADKTEGSVPLTVQFIDQSTGEITSWYWEFGNGETSTEQNPSHTYNSTGYFTVSLTVTGPGGSDTKIKGNYIHVTRADKEKLINGLKDLRKEILEKIDHDVTTTATAFADAEDLHRSLWLSDIFGATLTLIKETISWVGRLISAIFNPKELFTSSNELLEAFSILVSLENLTQAGENLELAIDGPPYSDNTEKMLKEAYEESSTTLFFNKEAYKQRIVHHLAGMYGYNPLRIARKSKELPRRNIEVVNGTDEVKTIIRDEFRRLIKDLETVVISPELLGEVTSRIKELKRQIV